MAPIYQVTDLLKVRDKAKDSTEVLRKINSEPAVRDHVLRSSTSSIGHHSTRSMRPRSSSIVTNPWEEIERPPNEHVLRNKGRNKASRGSKYSPTPSIKRGKAEKLLKEHGSPPGVRVTAGGRIVPDGLNGISIPRFDPADLTRYQTQGSSRAPAWMNGNYSMLKPLNGMLVDIGSGNLCQIVDGEVKPVYADNGRLRLYMPLMNPVIPSAPVTQSPLGSPLYMPAYGPPGNAMTAGQGDQNDAAFVPNTQVPSEREVAIMEQFQKNLENELKALDRDEVLHKNELTSNARSEIAKKRVELTLRIDECRRGVIAAKHKRESGLVHDNNSSRSEQNQSNQQSQPYCVGHSWPVPMVNPYATSAQHPFLPFPFQMPHVSGEFATHSPSATEYQHSTGRVIPLPYGQQYAENSVPRGSGALEFVPYGELQEPLLNSKTANLAMRPAASVEPASNGVKSMNLDGSTNQGRRSHAIEIKNPKENVAKAKPALDPTSPTYQPNSLPLKPSVSTHRTTNSTFIPSPQLVAKIDDLVQSPEQRNSNIAEGSDENAPPQGSSSSATTGDFFPHDTHRYSSTRYSFSRRNSGAGVPAWMGEGGGVFAATTTPVKGSKSFSFNDSPTDGAFHTAPNTDDRSHATRGVVRLSSAELERSSADDGCDMDFTEQGLFRRISPATREHQSAQLRTSASRIDSQSSPSKPKPSESAQTMMYRIQTSPSRSPMKSDSYLKGYSLGIKQEIMAGNQDDDYRRGYRDGLVFAANRSGAMEADDRSRHRQSGLQVDTALANNAVDAPSLSRASSFPMFNAPNVSAKSLSVNPELTAVCSRDVPPLAPPPPGSDLRIFSADAVSTRQIGTQTSNTQLRNIKPPSPLESRYPGNQICEGGVGKGPPYSARVPSMHAFDQQRFTKATTSIAPSNSHARGRFRQFDGSAEDETPKIQTERIQTPSSPVARSQGNYSPKPSGSPVRQKASAALARIEQLAGMNKKFRSTVENQGDEAKVPFEKERRRIKWSKRSENVKHSEQRDAGDFEAKGLPASPRP